ncbi:MAG: type I restriction enzyme HsdR N-terminal domain-containing protein [Armatimonadetes bacterium]|nr:type I restriction enzyme HsdR N-terminal domain-containing protein [Anaerolineae bacterium]
MDLIDQMRALATTIPNLKAHNLLRTEEGTKNALVMPFIQALGYNVFDPLEVTPELIADVGTKKGEKVDYAILRDKKPIILMECKIFGTNLREVHASQLYRYFTVTSSRFGILTDGVVYRFYTDLVTPNIMDNDPFFTFDLMDIKDQHIEELKKFSKAMFDEASIISSASSLKYKSLIKDYLNTQSTQPSPEFVRLALQTTSAYGGRLTQGVIDEFVVIVRESFRLFINDQVEARLKSALQRDTTELLAKQDTQPVEAAVEPDAQPAIVTTQDEIEAFFIIKAILRETVDVKRITMRDSQTYCSILLDDNNRRAICRLRFNGTQKYIGVFNDQRAEERIKLTTLDDLYGLKNQLVATVNFYDHKPA